LVLFVPVRKIFELEVSRMAKRTTKRKAKTTSSNKTKKSRKVKKAPQKTINFDYIKSNQFRVIHADGVHGGVRPSGQGIQIAFFNERQSIPRRETYNLDGMKLAGIKHSEKRDAIVREVEVEVLLDLDAAISLHKWLEEKINSSVQTLQNLQLIQKEKRGKKK